MEKTDAGFTISAIHLDVAGAGKACTVSQRLNTTITMDAKLN